MAGDITVIKQSGNRKIVVADSAAGMDDRSKGDVFVDGSHCGVNVGEMITHRLGLAEQVRFVVDPDDSTLAALYSGACLFVFPSLYEGFGWPPLEAMAYGCPVVCSSAASLPEVVGDAALQCAAEDEEGMARLCLDVLGDPSLAQRLVERGRARAEHFSLEHMASALLGVYQTVLSR